MPPETERTGLEKERLVNWYLLLGVSDPLCLQFHRIVKLGDWELRKVMQIEG